MASERQDNNMTANSKGRANVFDYSVKEQLSNLLQRTKVFQFDESLSRQFKLACVVQDRFHDAMEYLDSHLDAPKTDQELYLALVYADNVFSAVQEVFCVFKGEVKYPFGEGCDDDEQRKFFADIIKEAYCEIDNDTGECKELPEDKVPADDEFFKYFRALTFAHPYKTDVKKNRKFLEKGEIQYSPFVLHSGNLLNSNSGLIGVKVYSTVDKHRDLEIVLPYALLKDFLISRYNTLAEVNKYIGELLERKRAKWLIGKVMRGKTPLETFERLIDFFKERFARVDGLLSVVRLLETHLTYEIEKNAASVEKFKKALEKILSSICDAAERLDFDAAARLINAIISPELPDWPEQPDNGYRGMTWHRSKVAEYCFDGNRMPVGVAVVSVQCIMKGFAEKWVAADPTKISRDELWLLLSTAWYLESEACRKKGLLNRIYPRLELKI